MSEREEFLAAERAAFAEYMKGWPETERMDDYKNMQWLGWLERAKRAALATPSPEAAGSAEDPVAWDVFIDGKRIDTKRPGEDLETYLGYGCQFVPLYARAQNFRAGIEAAAKVAMSHGAIRTARAIEALAPPADAGEARKTIWQYEYPETLIGGEIVWRVAYCDIDPSAAKTIRNITPFYSR